MNKVLVTVIKPYVVLVIYIDIALKDEYTLNSFKKSQ